MSKMTPLLGAVLTATLMMAVNAKRVEGQPMYRGAVDTVAASHSSEVVEYSTIHIDNRTHYSIMIYLNGTYCGTVGDRGDIYCTVESGSIDMFGVATAEDGTKLTWGPNMDSVYGDYTWRLWP